MTYRFRHLLPALTMRALVHSILLSAGIAAAPGIVSAQATDVDWVVNLSDTGSDPLPAGGLISYTLNIGNAGVSPAPATTTTFSIPAGGTLESVSGGFTCPALPVTGPGTITCSVPALAPDAAVSGAFGVRTQAQGTLSVSVNVPTAGDVDSANNAATEVTTVLAGANLVQTITGPATATSGSIASYTLRVQNQGPDATSGMVVSFPRPTGFANITAPAGCTLSGNTYQCPVPGTLNAGSSATFAFSGQISAASGSTVTPVASVSSGTPADPNTDDNTRTFDTTVTAGSDLSLTKDRSPRTARVVGESLAFTLVARYTGDSPSAITVTDTLPSLYTPNSATGTGWTCTITGQTVSCTRPSGTGAGNDVALPTITINATAAQVGTATNTASVQSSSVDPNPANNSANDGGSQVLAPTIDLRANKSGPRTGLVVVGNSYTFGLSTTNIGTTGYTGTITLSDQLPAGYTITSAQTNGWTCTTPLPLTGPGTFTCTRAYTSAAPLAAGATTPRVDVTATATQTGARTNTLVVSSTGDNLPDTNTPNNTTSVTTTASIGPNAADISVRKQALNGTVVAGQVQTFSIEVVNTGPVVAQNITLSDRLEQLMNNQSGAQGAGFVGVTTQAGAASGVSCSTSQNSTTSVTLDCAIASLPICEAGVSCPVFEVRVRPGGNGGTRANTAEAYSASTADPNTANNSADATYTLTSAADITVSKVASPTPARAGQQLTYVITASNTANGLSAADNVVITDLLPAGLSFISATPSAGSCSTSPTPGAVTTSQQPLVCNMGTINNGAQRTLTVVVQPTTATRATTLTNTANVDSPTLDTNPDNNTVAIQTAVQNPVVDLLVNKVDSVDPVAIGDDTVYTITVRNNGPSAAENVILRDTLPANRLSYRSHTVSQGGICSTVPSVGSVGGDLACTWPTLPVGQTRTVTVTMRGEAKGVATSSATVSSDETTAGFETTPANNTTVQTTTVRTRADMQVVSKTPSVARTNLREVFTYTIRVRNNTGVGLSEADEVVVSDTLPANMEIMGASSVNVVSGTAAPIACTTTGNTAFSCALGTVSSGAVVDITIPVHIVAVSSYPQSFTNTATVTTSSLDVAPGNDSASNTVTIDSSSLTGRVFRDFNDNGTQDAVDTNLAGVTLTLTGTSFDGTAVNRTTTTSSSGAYAFNYLPQGSYTITRTTLPENHLNPGRSIAGSAGGTATSPTSITTIALPSNTAASGYTFTVVPVARIGLAKNFTSLSVQADGSVVAPARHTVRNYSLEPVTIQTITDPLSARFGTYTSLANPATDPLQPGQYTVYAITGSCGGMNTSFNGAGDTTLASNFSRPIGTSSCTAGFTLRFKPEVPRNTVTVWQNQSTMIGTGEWSGQTEASNPQLRDLSHTGTNPDPNNNGIANESGNNTPTTLSPTFAPQIRLQKTADLSGLSNPVSAGDTITYTLLARNSGNMGLANVAITDPLLGGAVGATEPQLLPGETITRTGTYTITAADIANRTITNQASVSGVHTLNGSTPSTVSDLSGTSFTNDTPTVVSLGDIRLVKQVSTAALSTPPVPGDVLSYTFTVINAGSVPLTNITLTESLPGTTISGGPIPSLAAGASDTTTFTAQYALTQADIDRGFVDNSATITGTYGRGSDGTALTVSDISGTAAANDTPTRAAVAQAPAVALVKTSSAAFTDPARPGDVISYGFTLTNTGNTTLSNLTLADALPGITLNAPAIASLAPGATDTSWTATYAITQADINRGFVENTAAATGRYTNAAGATQSVSDVSGTAAANNTPTRQAIPQSAALTLVKTADAGAVSPLALPGELVRYSFVVTNTGNTTLTSLSLVDTLPGIVLDAPRLASLNPGASHTGWTASYALTQADIDRGFVQNSATASGRYNDPTTGVQTASDISGATPADDTPTYVPLGQAGQVQLRKTADTTTLSTPPAVGDTVRYTFGVRNTGNTTLTNLTLDDPLPGLALQAPTLSNLAPGASDTSWTATYTLTQADIDRGFVENSATVTAGYTDANGDTQPVSDVSGTLYGNNTPTRVDALQEARLALVKEADANNVSAPAQVGQSITYAFTITNTGNTTLTDLALADALPGLVLNAPALATLAPGASDVSWTATYTLTQADIDRGFVENSATATGAYTDATGAAQTAQDTSGTAPTNDTPTRVAVAQSPAITLVKTADASAISATAAVGQPISYTFTVANTGNTTLTDVALREALAGIVLDAPNLTLAPGAEDATSWTASYAITQADIDRGFVENSATATGAYTDPAGTMRLVADVSGADAASDAPTRTPLGQNASVALVKTADTSALSAPAAPGDVITYAFTATNTGNTTLTTTLADALPGIALDAPALTLAPGAEDATSWTASYAITQADIDRGFVENSATATGAYTDGDGNAQTVSDTSGSAVDNDTPTRAAITQAAAIALVKSIDASALSTPAQPGDALSYGFTVTNTGNTTLSSVELADTLGGITLNAPTITSLAPGDSDTSWTASYVLTQADIDRGFVENTATATGSYTDAAGTPQTATDTSGTAATNDTPTRQGGLQAPAVALIKTVDIAGLSSPVVPGDTLAYAFTATNTGNTTLTDLDLSDALPGIALNAPTIASLAPGASDTSWTATYTLTQADIDRGFVENSATITGSYTNANGAAQTTTDLSGTAIDNDTPVRVEDLQTPSVALIKSVDTSGLSGFPVPGNTLAYTFTVTNTGNTTLTGLTLADALPGIVLDAPDLASLAPGASDTSWTATYALTQADIDRGFVENTATITAGYTDANGAPQSVADTSGSAADNDTPTAATVEQRPGLVLIKLADDSQISTPAALGDTITYTFIVGNSGNTTLTDVALEDTLAGIVLNAPTIASLEPGAAGPSWTGTYTLTQADINRGFVENSATATGTYTDATGTARTVSDVSGSATGNDDPTRQPLAQAPAVALLKSADSSGLSSPAAVGDTIAYSFAVTNTGNTTLTGLTLADALPGIVLDAPTITALAPGATAGATWTATYALTQADLDRGFVQNSATATGTYTDANGATQTIQDVSGTALDNDTPTRQLLDQAGSVALVKTVDISGLSDPAAVGDTLAYTFAVTNTGNTTLTGLTLSDTLPGIVLDAPALSSLAPGATDTSWTASYVLTQADIDRGFVENTATVRGAYTDQSGATQTVQDTSGATRADDAPTRQNLAQDAEIALIKSVDTSGLSTPAQAGDVLAYAFRVENTGNTTLTSVALTDALPGIVLDAPTIASLAPGADDTSWTATYTLTQADIDRGFVQNSATAAGSYTDANGTAQTAQDVSGSAADNDTPTRVEGLQAASLALVKTSDTSALSTPAAVGDTITYAFTATNTGNTTLDGVALADALPGIVLNAPAVALAPGASDTSWSATYALTQADIDRGFVQNTATAAGTYTDATGTIQTAQDVSGSAADNDTPTVSIVPQAPALALTKAVDTSSISSPAAVGNTLTYTFTVANTGNTTLTGVALADALPGITLSAPDLAALAPGASDGSWTATYAITQADIDRGFVQNSATATGTYTDTNGTTQTVQDASGTAADNDTPTRADIAQGAALALIKTADASGLSTPPAPGDTLAYSFVLTNTGNTTLSDLALADALPGIVLDAPTIASLAPGATDTSWTASYVLTQADIDRGFVENTATVTGTYTDGNGAAQTTQDTSGSAADNDTPTTTPIAQTGAIALVKSVDTSALSTPPAVGDVLAYGFATTNTGNTTLSNVSLADALPGIALNAPTITSLAPGATDRSWTATYTLTQSDIDRGFVENSATATGAYTDGNAATITVSDVSGTATDNDAPVRVDGLQAAAITLVKSADASGLSTPPAVGDTIAYAFTATNTGNTTLTGVSLADTLPGLALNAPTLASLAPGETHTGWTATYTLTQADIDRGFVENSATANGSYTNGNGVAQTIQDTSGTAPTNDTPTRVGALQAPQLALVKTVDTSAISTPARVGEVLAYAFTATNTGNTTLADLVLEDDLGGITLDAPTIASLAPGASDTSWTATYALTQADIDRGFVQNSATATGSYTDAAGTRQSVEDISGTDTTNDTPTRAGLSQSGALALVKTVSLDALSTPPAAGDTLSYAFAATNTGNTTLNGVSLADAMDGIVLDAPTIAALAPGATNTSWTATYVLTQADIDRGFVANTATATGTYTDANGAPQAASDTSGTEAGNDTPTRADLAQQSSIALTKDVDTSALSSPAKVGDVLTYTFAATNTGNTTLTSVALTDALPGIALDAPTLATLAPGAADTSWSATYALTQADIDRGFVQNSATINATTPTGTTPATVSDTSGRTTGDDIPTRADLGQAASLALVKTVDTSGLSTPAAPGDTLAYRFAVSNTGNTTIANIDLADDMEGIVIDAPTITTLAPGASQSTWNASYTLTQADIDRGFVENTATATGTYTNGQGENLPVADQSGTDASNDTPTRAALAQAGALALVKTVDTSALSTPPAAGDVLAYAFTLANTGNTTLADLTLTDDLDGITLNAPTIAALAPGATDTSWTATYALTQADIDRGFVENTATATGSYVDDEGTPQPVADISGTDAGNDTPTQAAVGQAAALDLVKTVDTSALSTPVVPGDVLSYSFTLTNTGNTTLRNVVLGDDLAGIALNAPAVPALEPGASHTSWTATYAITQADLDRGYVNNTATATGTYTDASGAEQTTTDQSGTQSGQDDPTRATFAQDAAISLIKEAFVDRKGGISEVGDTIRYAFTITNTGNVTLTDVAVQDALEGVVLEGAPIASLAPGASDTSSYTATYAVTAEDFAAAKVENQATVTGTYTGPDGTPAQVSAQSGTQADNTAPTVVEIGLPALALSIDIADTLDRDANGRLNAGDGVVFRFTLTNTGNVPLTNANIVPGSLSLPMPGLSCTPVSLAVGESAVLECTNTTYTVRPADVANGTIRLEGQATAVSPGGVVVDDQSAAAALPVGEAPGRTLVAEKTSREQEVRVGDTVHWTITIRHPQADGVPVDIAITDVLPAGFALREGSTRLDGRQVDVRTEGNRIVFPTRTIAPNGTVRATLETTVLSIAGPGTHTNKAAARNAQGTTLSNTAEATVRVVLDPVFGCGTIVGRVFDDSDANGSFNTAGTGEVGLGGVRLVAPNGIAVFTDQHGRFNLPCEAVPSNIGSNFQLKLDTRTLPTGFEMTTENPRVVRLTPGMITRMDFGATAPAPITIELNARAFPGGAARPELQAGLEKMARDLDGKGARVHINYTLSRHETVQSGRNHLQQARRLLEAHWRGERPLHIETTISR